MKLKSLTKKKAVLILVALAIVLAIAVYLCGPKQGFVGIGELCDVQTPQGRAEYLASLGWEVDISSEEHSTVILPESFDGALSDYSALQSEQGFELCSYAGKECDKYSYIVTNYPAQSSTVYAILFIKGGTVIGGDIHSVEIGGFLHGIK